jgi:pimeloyl-ACP methyl ester carboxylesterase
LIEGKNSASAPAAEPQIETERSVHLALNGLRILCREWGEQDAHPVVLLHGLRGYSATWRPLAERLRHRYRLIAIDQRGRGESDWDPARNYYTDAYLADLEALVDWLGLEQFALIGHSMGGTTSYVYAARHAARLSALVIEDMAPGSSVQGAGAARIVAEMNSLPADFASWEEARVYWRMRRPSLSADAIEQRLAESLRRGGDGRIVWQYDAEGIKATRLAPDSARVVDLWPVLQQIRTPTLIIRGGQSDFCPESVVAEACRRNPALSWATVTGATHYVHDDSPEVFADLVESFLAAHTAGGTSQGT